MMDPRRLTLLLLPGAILAGQAVMPSEAVVQELNLARRDPRGYAAYLRPQLAHFNGRRLEMPGEVILETNEGEKAVREAIAFLEQQPPLPALRFIPALAQAAADHVAAQGPTGQTGHKGPQGQTMEQRVDRRGAFLGLIGEAIAYGNRDPRAIVVQLIIDDGVASRGHRKAVFQKAFRQAGAAVGPHASYGVMAVIDFAEDFTSPP